MVKYLKSQISHIPFVLIVFIFYYAIATFAAGEFNSIDIRYDNMDRTIQSSTVGNAIDELYTKSSNYALYNERLTSVEGIVGNNSFTTTSKTLIVAINDINGRFNNGVVPLLNGGTGATTAADARTAFGVPSKDDIPAFSSITGGQTNGINYNVFKYGNIVTLRINGSVSKAISSGTTILTVPEGYRPNTNAYLVANSNYNSGSAYKNVIRCAINASTGALTAAVSLASSNSVNGTVTYVSS